MQDEKFWYQCVNCKTEYSGSLIMYLCPECSKSNINELPPKGVLKVLYNYDELKGIDLVSNNKCNYNSYLELLPVNDIGSFSPLKVGNTPLCNFSAKTGSSLFFKDDSHNPTYSFKDRATVMVSAFAKEHNINRIITASTGNAGSSLAGICASQGQEAIVLLPHSAPKAKIIQSAMYGANLIQVNGSYDDCLALSKQVSDEMGIYNRNTAYNPITIEGKKTVAFELYYDFNGQLPGYIFVAVGDGCIISGIYKGFEDLLKLDLIQKMPTIVGVQSEASAAIVNNLNSESFQPATETTVADSIQVNVPQNFYMTKDYLIKFKGMGIRVNDSEILSASEKLSNNTGLFAEPAAAAAYAGYLKLLNNNSIPSDCSSLILLTGSGLKDTLAYTRQVNIKNLAVVNLASIKKLLD